MTLGDRYEDLLEEAQRANVADKVHNIDLTQAILAFADLLGYDRLDALDLTEPLSRRPSAR